MNTEIVPREVAEAIEIMRIVKGVDNLQILHQAEGAVSTKEYLTLQNWAFDEDGGTVDRLMRALVIGYEVEKTPEEKVREYYLSVKRLAERTKGTFTEAEYVSESIGIKRTLDKLGIAIEGVNV